MKDAEKPQLLKEIEELMKSGMTAKQAALVALGIGGLLNKKKKKDKKK